MIESLELNQRVSSSTVERVFAAVGFVAASSILAVIGFINPTTSSMFPTCPFRALTGLHCPGCGVTRGMHQLLHGDLLSALDYNALLIVFVPMIVFFMLTLLSIAIRGRRIRFPGFAPKATWGLLVVLLVFGVLRNLPFYPFTILAP